MNKVIVVIFAFLYASAGIANTMQEAVENPARTEKDRNLDAKRKPSEVLEFFGIKPGMNVLDVFGGGLKFVVSQNWMGGRPVTSWGQFGTSGRHVPERQLPSISW